MYLKAVGMYVHGKSHSGILSREQALIFIFIFSPKSGYFHPFGWYSALRYSVRNDSSNST